MTWTPTRKTKAATRPGRPDPPKKHFCPEHDEEAKIVAIGFKKRIHFQCPQGCLLRKGATVKR